MKIYIFAMHLAYGGVEKAVCAMANLFVELGYPVKIICTYKMPDAPAYELSPLVEIEYLLSDIPNRIAFYDSLHHHHYFHTLIEGCRALKIIYQKKTRVKKSMRKITEGIIISTRNEDSVVLSKYGHENVYKIAQLHHDHGFEKRYVRDFEKHYEGIDCFVLLTAQLRDEVQDMMRRAGNLHTQCVAIPNFMEVYPKLENLDNKELSCVAVGRLHPVKGFDRMISLFQKIHARCPRAHLRIVGDGSVMASLAKQITDLHLENTVTLTGAKSEAEVMTLMQSSSIYLMTSHSEGFPFVLLEAKANALPCVAYDVRVGPRAVISDGVDGFLVADDDEETFVQRVVTLLQSDELRNKMALRAYENGKRFTKQEVSGKWKQVLERDYTCL